MWNGRKSLMLSVVVCFLFVGILTAGLFFGPWAITMWFTVFRGWSTDGEALSKMLTLFKACFYPCAAFAYVTLYSLIRMLFNIRKGDLFIISNVRYLRRISWCCFAVALITLVGGWFYIPFSLVAVVAAFVGLMLRVVKNVMQSAVEIRVENELTI